MTTETKPIEPQQAERVAAPVDRVVMPAVVVFDCGEAHLYGRGADGRIDYDRHSPWPSDWPSYITPRFLEIRRIPWTTA